MRRSARLSSRGVARSPGKHRPLHFLSLFLFLPFSRPSAGSLVQLFGVVWWPAFFAGIRGEWKEGACAFTLRLTSAIVSARCSVEEDTRLMVTPFEKNLEVWRQLWRVLEKSHVVVQVVDARDPLLYRCEDVERYVEEVSTR